MKADTEKAERVVQVSFTEGGGTLSQLMAEALKAIARDHHFLASLGEKP